MSYLILTLSVSIDDLSRQNSKNTVIFIPYHSANKEEYLKPD